MDVTSLVQAAAAKYGLDPALLQAVIQQESAGKPDAVSSSGAQGLMQLMPSTAASLGVTDPFDPAQNVDAGARYLQGLLNQYGGNVTLALAAYNAGPGRVAQYGGVPPFPETQNYVSSILDRIGQGFTPPASSLSTEDATAAGADLSALVPVASSGLTGTAWLALAAAALAVVVVASQG